MTSLITLPIRLALEITWRAAKLGVGVVRAVAGLLERDEPERVVWVMEEEPRDVAPEAVVIVEEEPPPAPEPRHVDSEPTLSYEAGPAEDPGATIHVSAPWDGYDRMRAADILD